MAVLVGDMATWMDGLDPLLAMNIEALAETVGWVGGWGQAGAGGPAGAGGWTGQAFVGGGRPIFGF